MLNQNQSKNTLEYQDIKLAWRINPSFSHDLFHFLWSIAENTYCSRHYPNEKAEWRARLASDIMTRIDEVTDWQTSHLFQSSLGTMFHFSDADSIDRVFACLTEPEPMKTGMLEAGAHPGWTDSIFQHLEASKGKLQMIISALKEAGYEEYWHQEIEPIVAQKCGELQRELSRYDIQDILDNINGLLGPGYNVTHGGIHLTYFSAGVAYHLPDNSSVQSFPINIRQLVSTLIHEWLHNFTQSSELREWYDGLYASPFFSRSRELLGSWGSGSDEDFVVAMEKHIAVKLGITSPEEAFHCLYTNWDASLVLGVIVYHQMNEKALKGKTYEAFLLDLFTSGRIQAENLEQQYIAALETHIGHEQSQIAYSTCKMRNSIQECRHKG